MSRYLSFHGCMLAYQKEFTALRMELSAGAEAVAVTGKTMLATMAPITGR